MEASFFLLLIIVLCPVIHPCLQGALLAWIGSAIVTALLLLLYLAIQVCSSIRFRISELGHKLAYGGKAMASGLAQTLTLQLGLFIVGYFLEPAEVGLFYLAFTLFNMAGRSTTVLGRVLFPYNSSVDFSQAMKLTNITFRFLLAASVLSLFFCVPAFLYGVPLIFGSAYRASGLLLIIMFPGAIALFLMRIIYVFFLGQGYPEKAIIAYISSLITVGLLDILLIPRLGMVGGAIGLAGAYIIGLTTLMYQYVSFANTSYAKLCKVTSADFQLLKEILQKAKSSLSSLDSEMARDT